MAKKSFSDIKKTTKPVGNKIPMKIYAPILEKRGFKESEEKIKTNPFFEKSSPIKTSVKKIDPEYYPEIKTNRNGTRHVLWIVAAISVLVLFFAISYLLSKATITIIPKVKPISLNANFSALKDASADDISYDLVTLSDESTKTITGGQEKDVKNSAVGKVLLYNTYSASPQQLLVDTRLEGSNGKIYKTKVKTIIPGKSADGAPGKISVDIYANEPGSDYNSDPIDFKIYGFKNSPKYTKFYGRSVGAITGGLIGKSRDISDAEKTKAEDNLKTDLEDKLYKKAQSQIPSGFILYKTAISYELEDVDVSTGDDGSFNLSMKGTLNGFVLDEKKLTDKIIANILPDDKNSDKYISNLSDLTLTISNKDSVDFLNASKFDFNIYGVPKVIYKIDESKIATDLAGRSKKEFSQILSNYPNIDSAEMSIKPVWRMSFSDDSNKIKIIIKYP